MIRRSFDEADGIIFVTGEGAWSLEDVDLHFAELGAMLTSLRTAGRPIRILTDVTSGERQPEHISASVLRYHEMLYDDGDRIAMLVAPADKAHVLGLLGKADVATFNSRMAAEMWLMTPDLAKPA